MGYAVIALLLGTAVFIWFQRRRKDPKTDHGSDSSPTYDWYGNSDSASRQRPDSDRGSNDSSTDGGGGD